ncbi:MAG: ABC transporter permease [bacterium]|nr:ABC transporter permease [bacterium]
MNNVTFKLWRANIKMLFRDKQALFWSLAFPLLFLVIFGLFNFDAPTNFSIAIIDEAQSEQSEQLKFQMLDLEIFTETEIASREEALETLKDGDLDGIITIPASYGQFEGVEGAAPEPSVFSVTLDETNQQSAIIVSVLNQFLNELNLQIASAPRLFTIETEGVQGQEVKYLDFLMPGVLGMAIMFSAIIGIAVGITRYRERKILKRLMATPVKVQSFLMAEVGSYLFLSFMQIALILGVGRIFFGIQVYGSYFYLILVTLVGTIVFLNIGFFIAGMSKTVNTAEAMSNAFTTPMMFLSGVFFSPDMLPGWMERIVDFLPLTSLLKVLRGISINGSPLTDFPYQFALLGGWIVVSFVLAWKTFRMDRA